METKSLPSGVEKNLQEIQAQIEALSQRKMGYLMAVMSFLELKGSWSFDEQTMQFIKQEENS